MSSNTTIMEPDPEAYELAPVTYLFIHGLCHSPAHIEACITRYRSRMCPFEYPLLPSHNVELNQVSSSREGYDSFEEDVKMIRERLTQLVEEGQEVMVMMHSYGAMVSGSAIHKDLSKVSRQAEGKKGGVLGLTYFSGFILPVGKCLASIFGDKLPDYINCEVSLINEGCFLTDTTSFRHHTLRLFLTILREMWKLERVPFSIPSMFSSTGYLKNERRHSSLRQTYVQFQPRSFMQKPRTLLMSTIQSSTRTAIMIISYLLPNRRRWWQLWPVIEK